MSEDLYQLYLDEIEAIPPCDPAENAVLAVSLAGGDERAKTRLVEGNLKLALTCTKDYLNKGIPVNDLIQEANMALMLAVESYGALAASRMSGEAEGQKAHLSEGALEQYLDLKIGESLDAAIKAQEAEAKVEEIMLARVNVMKDVTQKMAEELGREATVEELAEQMKMTVDEVKEIMKLTLDAMSLNEDCLNGDYEE